MDVYFNFYLTGPCHYRKNNGEISIWVLPSLVIKKMEKIDKHKDEVWDNLKVVFKEERRLETWLATYDGPTTEPLPQGNLGVDIQPLRETPHTLFASKGETYIIEVQIQVAMIATHNATVTLGEIVKESSEVKFLEPVSIYGGCFLRKLVFMDVDSRINFNSLTLGNRTSKKLIIRNKGDLPLFIAIPGSDSGKNFQWETLNKTEIAPGDSLEHEIIFAPFQVGEIEEYLLIHNNTSHNAKSMVFLRGTGLSRRTECVHGEWMIADGKRYFCVRGRWLLVDFL